jgi:thiamine-phosphate diphosphorylase
LAEARLYLLLIGEVLPGVNHETALRAAIEGGAEIVQLREKGMPDRGFFHLAQRLRTICEDAGVLFLTNDRPHITVAVDADGVHLGAEDLPVPAARRILGPEKIIGATAHRIDEAIDGQAQGADYLGIGTMFPTTTKPGLEPHGCELFRELQGRVEIPVFAVGGITIENLPRLLAIGVRRVAVASGLLHAPDIRQRAAAFKRLLLEAP